MHNCNGTTAELGIAIMSKLTRMTQYRTVVNDHGTFRGMYDSSADTLNIFESPSFEKPSKRSFRRIVYCLSPLTQRVSRAPGVHRFRIWLNRKPVLTLQDSNTSSHADWDQVSDELRYEPLQSANSTRNSYKQSRASIRDTVRRWFCSERRHVFKEPISTPHSESAGPKDSTTSTGLSTSTLAEPQSEFKKKHALHTNHNFEGPTAII